MFVVVGYGGARTPGLVKAAAHARLGACPAADNMHAYACIYTYIHEPLACMHMHAYACMHMRAHASCMYACMHMLHACILQRYESFIGFS